MNTTKYAENLRRANSLPDARRIATNCKNATAQAVEAEMKKLNLFWTEVEAILRKMKV